MKQLRVFLFALSLVLCIAPLAQAAPNGPKRAVQLCPVHKVRLRHATVRIVYGDIGLPVAYMRAAPVQFPFANRVIYAGTTSGAQTHAAVLYCNRCRKAERRWRGNYERSRRRGGELQPTVEQLNLFLRFQALQKIKGGKK